MNSAIRHAKWIADIDAIRQEAAVSTMAQLKRRFNIKCHHTLVDILDDYRISVPASGFTPVERHDYCSHCNSKMLWEYDGLRRRHQQIKRFCQAEHCQIAASVHDTFKLLALVAIEGNKVAQVSA